MTACTIALLIDTLLVLSTSGSLITPSQLAGAVIFVPSGIAILTIPNEVAACTSINGSVASLLDPTVTGVTATFAFFTPKGTVIVTAVLGVTSIGVAESAVSAVAL
ncbi:hypothetical protein D3C71_1834810 [compost metagenome]